MTPLIDVGVNLTHRSFAGDLPEVLARAQEAGVIHQVVTGTSLPASRAAVQLARRYPGQLTATVGIHPHHASEFGPDSVPALRRLAARGAHDRAVVVAIGECGLDYDRDFSPRGAQRECFASQLALAAELGLPVFLHQRAAHEDFLAILREHRGALRGAVVHCFTGSEAEVEAYQGLECHIGITGWITDQRRGSALRRSVTRVQAGRLLLETDAPFLLPHGASASFGRRNEPAFLSFVLEAVARATGRAPSEIAAETTRNALGFFGLDASLTNPPDLERRSA